MTLLLDLGANANALNTSGATALHSAAANGAKACVEVLLDRGADPRILDNNNNTPLDCAELRAHNSVVKAFESEAKKKEKEIARVASPKAWHKKPRSGAGGGGSALTGVARGQPADRQGAVAGLSVDRALDLISPRSGSDASGSSPTVRSR
eukprot:SAG22_NODE_4037_length_1413_cov_1.307458_1_plen_150_part_10